MDNDQSPATPSKRRLYTVLAAAFLGWMFDGLEMGIFPLIVRPALQSMQLSASGTTAESFVGLWMGYATASFLIGGTLGGLLFGWLGDKFGRVRAMAWSIICYSIFTGLIYVAIEPWHLCALRFAAATGMGGEWALGVALVFEVWPERYRHIVAGVVGSAAQVGHFAAAMIGLAFAVTVDSWRWVALVGVSPALIVFFIRKKFVGESEKWAEANKPGAGGSNPLKEALTPPLLKRTIAASAIASVGLLGTWGSVAWLPLWADQLTGGAMPNAKALCIACSSFGAGIGCLLGSLAGGWIGRRPAYCVMCGSALVLTAIMFRGIDSFGLGFLAMVLVTNIATASFFGWMPLYLPELFPTRVRATAQGINSGRIVAAMGALQTGALMQGFEGSYAHAGATMSLVYAVGLAVIWFAPETRGRRTPE
jgi:predicted MFS family arabinose efflux permease